MIELTRLGLIEEDSVNNGRKHGRGWNSTKPLQITRRLGSRRTDSFLRTGVLEAKLSSTFCQAKVVSSVPVLVRACTRHDRLWVPGGCYFFA